MLRNCVVKNAYRHHGLPMDDDFNRGALLRLI
jgi:hypothetical protein